MTPTTLLDDTMVVSRSHPPLEIETLAAARADRKHRWGAACFCGVAVITNMAVLPFVSAPMPTIPGFLAFNQTALLLVNALTTWLLFAQFHRTGSLPLVILGAGLLYTTAVILVQLVCFPGLLQPNLLLGRGLPTLTWLWTFWHLGVPLVALAYVVAERNDQNWKTSRRPVMVMLVVITATLAAAAASLFASVQCLDELPRITDADGGYRALTTSGVGPALSALTVLSLVVVMWATQLRSLVQLWLAVSLFLLLLDNVITDLGAARVTVGWFVGRLDALLASLVVLGIYLVELNRMHGRTEASAISREAARIEAQNAREHLDLVLKAAEMGGWNLDLASGHSHRTSRHDRIFGYHEPQADWGWNRFLDHVIPDDRALAVASSERAFRSGRLELECRIRRVGDGAIRWISVQGRTSFDRSGRAVSLAGCVADITDQRRIRERLQHAEHMEAMGQLTGGLAHDFNNLLMIILGNLDVITRDPTNSDRVERLAQSAFIAGRRGRELTDKLLAYSRRQVERPETLNLNCLAAELEPLLQQAVGAAVSVELDLDPHANPIRLDPGQFQAALLNLAGNARDAMPRGGQFRLETRNVELDFDDLAALPEAVPGSYLRITVSDTGTGMDATTASRAFEPFFTTKEVGKGTGLGLSQVYGLVTQAGGLPRIKTAPGHGCSIELYFPCAREEISPASPKQDAAGALRPAVNGEVVLIVEDDDAIRELASESLEGLGYGVLSAPDARIALDILRGPGRVDIVFSDVIMPGGMNGAQLAVEARTVRPGLKVLLTSGYTNTRGSGTRELPEDIPLLRKPYLREELVAHLRSVMESETSRTQASC